MTSAQRCSGEVTLGIHVARKTPNFDPASFEMRFTNHHNTIRRCCPLERKYALTRFALVAENTGEGR